MAIKPIGKNKLNAFTLFEERKKYKEESYPDLINDDVPIPIDLWYEKNLYGRLDREATPIYPLFTKLKKINSSNENLFALNFVVDAFEDFRNAYFFLQKDDASNSPFEFLIPSKAWADPATEKQQYMDALYNMMVEAYLPFKKRYENVRTFMDFVNEFTKFMNEKGQGFPVTMTNFITSKFTTPMISGIMIEVDDSPHDDDENKYENFLTHACFRCYTTTAEKFGFKIDKNAPWRLVADLKSPIMQKYMEKYIMKDTEGTTPAILLSFSNLFDYYYNRSYEVDANLIKEALVNFYYSYVRDNPVFTLSKFSIPHQKTVHKIIERELIGAADIDQRFSDSFWVTYYIRILLAENPQSFSDADMRIHIVRAQTITKQQGITAGSKYVYTIFGKKSVDSKKKI
jgi:hypothetical protein